MLLYSDSFLNYFYICAQYKDVALDVSLNRMKSAEVALRTSERGSNFLIVHRAHAKHLPGRAFCE